MFRQMEGTDAMYGYGDLAVLKDLPVQRFLVTSGFRRLQESKVRALGFADWFAGIYIYAIDESNRRGENSLFPDNPHPARLPPPPDRFGGGKSACPKHTRQPAGSEKS